MGEVDAELWLRLYQTPQNRDEVRDTQTISLLLQRVLMSSEIRAGDEGPTTAAPAADYSKGG